MSEGTVAVNNAKATPEVTRVTMRDGREVDFVGKRQMLKSFVIEDGRVKSTFDFKNGETRTFILPEQLTLHAAGHGTGQKVGDSAAGEKEVGDMVLAVDSTIEQLLTGEWNTKRESGGFSGASVVLKALMEKTGKDLEAVKEFVEKKITESGATRQAIYNSFRASSALQPIIARLEAESAKKASKFDAEAGLAELEAA